MDGVQVWVTPSGVESYWLNQICWVCGSRRVEMIVDSGDFSMYCDECGYTREFDCFADPAFWHLVVKTRAWILVHGCRR